MRAARVHRFGDPLQIDELADPEAGPGEVLVDVEFAGVNPIDVWVTKGTVANGGQSLPFVPGLEAVAMLDDRWYVVYGFGYGTTRDGLYRERAAVSEGALFALPEGVDPAQAAAMPVAGRTAWWLVNDVAPVKAGDRVIVLGASGGVGSLVVQLAKARSAVVWGQTTNHEKAESITAAGADRVVVANADDLATQLVELTPTIAFDALGGNFTRALVEAMDLGGRIGLYGTSSNPEATLDLLTLYRKGVSLLPGSVPPDRTRAAIEAALAELAAGRLWVRVDEIFPLDRAAEAHRRILDKAVRGKLLLRP
jgi:NADPH2:quinone reductase